MPPELAEGSRREVTFSRVVLWLTAVAFIGFGLAFALWPEPMARITEIALPTPTARIDYVATYGGFQTAFGVFLVACARRSAWLEPGLWAAAASLAGFGLFRLLGVAMSNGPVGTPIYVGLGLELGGAALNLLALRAAPRVP